MEAGGTDKGTSRSVHTERIADYRASRIPPQRGEMFIARGQAVRLALRRSATTGNTGWLGNRFRSSRSEEYPRRMACYYKHVAPTERRGVPKIALELESLRDELSNPRVSKAGLPPLFVGLLLLNLN